MRAASGDFVQPAHYDFQTLRGSRNTERSSRREMFTEVGMARPGRPPEYGRGGSANRAPLPGALSPPALWPGADRLTCHRQNHQQRSREGRPRSRIEGDLIVMNHKGKPRNPWVCRARLRARLRMQQQGPGEKKKEISRNLNASFGPFPVCLHGI